MATKIKLNILIVDDQPDEVEPLITLVNMNSNQYEIVEKKARTKDAAFELMEKENYDLIFLDIAWEDSGGMKPEGIQILREIRTSIHGFYPVIMLTNFADRGFQKTCLELGCDGFLDKSRDLKVARLSSLEYLIEKTMRVGELRKNSLKFSENKSVVRDKDKISRPSRKVNALVFEKGKVGTKDYRILPLYGTSKPMVQIFQEIIRIAAEPESPNVLIGGGTGVGKSTVARLMHLLSGRSEGPFHEVVLNTIPPNLIESTLFGIERRVASEVDASKGIIEQCDKGTLFLDEIGELPLVMQVKLLRAIREKVITRVGGGDVKVDFKLISATNRNLRTLVKDGIFRLDLYQRICGVELAIPSLQERFQNDSSELDDLIRREMNGRRFTFEFTDAAIQAMLKHDWPGNYAEFKTLIDNLSLESTSLVDEQMVIPRLMRLEMGIIEGASSLRDILNTTNHKSAVNSFKREHVQYWIKKEGSLKAASLKLEIDESTIHRILGRDQEEQ